MTGRRRASARRRVYEYLEAEEDGSRARLRRAACIHCKTCDIKCPSQNIDWVVPEVAAGPRTRGCEVVQREERRACRVRVLAARRGREYNLRSVDERADARPPRLGVV